MAAFLGLASAIATRQIVISIGGLFGIGKGAQAGGGGVIAPGAAMVGAEEIEYRLAA